VNATTTLFTDIFKYRRMCQMKLHIYAEPVPLTHDIGLFDIAVYPAVEFVPPATVSQDRTWEAAVANVNDRDVGTYWMSPPWENGVNVYLDLGHVYNVFDIFVWFVLLPQGFSVWVSTVGFNTGEVEKKMTSTDIWGRMRLEVRGVAFPARFIRLDLFKSYQDPEFQLGSSVRDIAVYQFRNLAQSAPTSSDTVWSYPSSWVTDSDSATYWMSRFDAPSATMVIDLGEEVNVAGITGVFKHVSSFFRISYSSDNSTWQTAYTQGGNIAEQIYISPRDYHFRGRYVKFYMSASRGFIDHPDDPGNAKAKGYVFGLTSLQVWEHTGGGGAVGLQNLDGSQFNSIVWGQRQPGEWMLGSESDIFTQDVDGGAYKEDEGNPAHIVVTFRKVESIDPRLNLKRTEIAFYRNGMPYGTAYQESVDPNRLSLPNQTRLVVGIRSSAFANQSFDTSTIQGTHSETHSPYFWGKIYNVTLIKNALAPEEVQGLYHVVRGGEELGCHCFDACPVGYNRFDRTVPVPCSGQGVCLRNADGIPQGRGQCECLPGFSGDNCQAHCSELSKWGCCEIDDDCPAGTVCNKATKACSENLNDGSSTGFYYY